MSFEVRCRFLLFVTYVKHNNVYKLLRLFSESQCVQIGIHKAKINASVLGSK